MSKHFTVMMRPLPDGKPIQCQCWNSGTEEQRRKNAMNQVAATLHIYEAAGISDRYEFWIEESEAPLQR